MATERSDRAYEHWLQGSQQFDYFVAGIAVALVGYLGADVAPAPLALNAGTLRLAAAAVLLASVGCGLKKIDTHLALLHLTQRRLYLQEAAGAHAQMAVAGGTHLNEATGEVVSAAVAAERVEFLSQQAAALTKEIEDLRDGVDRWRLWRNAALVIGLGLLIGAQALGVLGHAAMSPAP